jgi:hypothetical protein
VILPNILIEFSKLETFAVTHRQDDIPEFCVLDRTATLESLRLIREHIVSRIVVLSGTPLPPPVQ